MLDSSLTKMCQKTCLATLLGLVLCLAFASARYTPWAAGSEYVYRLHAISVSDIPELGSQAAGVKFDAQLMVQCRDAVSIIVKLVDVTAWNYHTDIEESWNELESNHLGTQVPVEGKSFLEKPFIIRHREGLFESLVVGQDEPVWSINMKKAVASKLQLHVSGSRSVESASRNFGLPTEDTTEDVNAVFKVFESGVTGECETLYEIAPLSDALVRSDSKLNPVPKLCVEGTFFQVVKTKDYSKCRLNKPVYNVIAPSGWQCKPGIAACGTARSRSSVSRYIACGSLESFTLLKMTHQGEIRSSPYAYDTEQLRALSLMKLTLQAVRHAATYYLPAWLPKDMDNSLSVSSLVYSFPGTSTSGHHWMSDGLMRSPPLRDVDQLHQGTESIRDEVERLLAKAVDQIEESQEEAAVDTIAAISYFVRHLDYHQISNLVGDIGHRSTLERSILLDAVMAAGNNPSVVFLKESILNRRLSRTESLNALSGLAVNIRTPTTEVLNELFGMLKATSTFSGLERPIYHSAMLSVSQLAHMACVNGSESITRFPEGLYGDFCQPNDPFVISKLVPLLSKEINGAGSTEDKIAALTALGELGHEAALSIVLPIIKSKNDYSPMIRTKAVISLHKIAHDSNDKIIQVLSTTFQNPTESSEVRMAAFTLLILANPPAYRWQRIAVSTWFEHSAQVASFVYTTLHSLANNVQPVENMKELSEKAQIVLPLAKRVPLGLKYSFNLKRSRMAAERNAGAEFHSEVFNTEESIFPKSLYSRLSWILGPYHFDIFELEAYGENWRSALDRILTHWNPSSDINDGSHTRNGRFFEYDNHPDLRRIKKQLNAKNPIPTQDAGSADAFLHLSLMKGIHRFASFNEADITDMIKSVWASSDVPIKREFSRRRWLPLTHAEVLVPNTLGLMITTRTQALVLSSCKGNIQITRGNSLVDIRRWSSAISSKNVGLEADIKPTLVVKVVSTMSVNAEFTKALPVTGVDTHVTVSLPGRLTMAVELDNWKLMLAWKPASSGPAGLTTLYHYHVRPFTALQSISSDLPANPNPGESKIVHASGVNPVSSQHPIGGKSGLKLNWTSRSELPAEASHRSIWQEPLAKVLMDANFALMPASLHYQSYRVTLDPAASETHKIILSFNLDAADKLDRGTQVYNTGSKSPASIKEPANRIQYLTTNMEPQIKKKLTKVLGPVPKGSAIHVEAKLIMERSGAPAKIYGASFAGAYGTEGTKLAVNAQLELPLNQQTSDPFTLCIEGGGHYPRFPSLDRRTLMETRMEAAWNATIGFGDSCTDYQIIVDADMRRSEAFSRHVVESPENHECIMHEARGEFSHEQCLAVKELASVLDEYDITVNYGYMLPVLANMTLSFEGWLRSKFYAHLSENRVEVNNANKQLRVSVRVEPSLSAVDLMLFKPHSNTFFRHLPLSKAANVVFPLNAKSSLTERLIDNTISDGFAPICRLERDSITTFDKVQYNAQVNDCEHVVLAAPGIETLAVLMRQEGENKIVTLLVGRDKLEVSAADHKIRYNDMDVIVADDKPLEVHQADQVYQVNSRPSVGVYKVGPAAFKLSAHGHDIHIVTDASSSVTIKAPRSFQGKMIGLCGNMDGETVSELRDPQRCILSSGAVMAASYQLNEGQQGRQCSGMVDKIRGQLREEQNSCHNKPDWDTPTPPPIYPTPSSSNADACFTGRTLVVVRSVDDAKCFSTSTVRECRSSCQGLYYTPKTIGFHCVTNSKLGEELEQEAKHRVLTSMHGQKADIRTSRNIPTACLPKNEHAESSKLL